MCFLLLQKDQGCCRSPGADCLGDLVAGLSIHKLPLQQQGLLKNAWRELTRVSYKEQKQMKRCKKCVIFAMNELYC